MRICFGDAREWLPDAPAINSVWIEIDRDGTYMTVEYADGTQSQRIHVGGREGVDDRVALLADLADADEAAAA